MNTSRLLAQALRTFRAYPLRSSFMMLGCFLGVAALTLVLSLGTSVEKRLIASTRMYFSASSIFVTTGGNPFAGGPRGQGSRLTLDDLESVAASIPGIDTWDPTQVLDPAPLRTSDGSTTGRVLGASERSEQVWQRGVTRGEYFDVTAVTRATRVALVGTTIERELFKNQDAVGSEILIGGAPFRVIGVLERIGTDIHGLDRDNEVFIPITTLMRRVMNVDTIRAAKILVKDPARVAETATELRRALRDRHGLAPGQSDDFTVVTPVQVQQLVSKTRRVLFLFLPLVAGVALLVGGVVSAALMLMSVSERVGEIGLRRAVGANPRDIAAQFLCETAFISLTGGLLGAATGSGLALVIAQRFALPASVSFPAVILGFSLSIVTGLFAGVMPARRAARLLPVEALR